MGTKKNRNKEFTITVDIQVFATSQRKAMNKVDYALGEQDLKYWTGDIERVCE